MPTTVDEKRSMSGCSRVRVNGSRNRAHFVGAPFFVRSTSTDMRERFGETGYNTGNLLIGDATARLIDADIVSVGTGVDADVLNDTADLIVIPSANFLSPAMDVSWLIPVIEGTYQPVLMIGVGAQFPTMKLSDAELPEATKRLMKMVSERSVSIGVRGQFTADVLEKYGIRNTRVTGCPSLFRRGRKHLEIKKPSGRSVRPLFNGSNNVMRHAYSSLHARKVELKLIDLAMTFDAPFIFQNELPEMLWLEDGADQSVADACLATLRRLEAEISPEKYLDYLRRRGKVFFDVESWSQLVAGHDAVIGTRFHGNMIALSQGIAAVSIAHDSRTTELCEALHIPYIGLEEFLYKSLDEILDALDFSEFEKNYPAARSNLAQFFDENGVAHRLGWESEEDIVAAYRPIYRRFTTDNKLHNGQDARNPPERARQPRAKVPSDPIDQMKFHIKNLDLPSAAAVYETAPVTHPKYLGATQLLAESFMVSDPDFAVRLANKAIEMDSKNMKSYWICASALLHSNLLQKASDVAKLGLTRGTDPHWTSELGKLVN